MRLFQRLGTFQRGPLLPAVPLDGTQTVAGLRELERQAVLQTLQREGPPARPTAPGAGAHRRRYNGPRLAEQPLQAWRTPPRDWEPFLLQGGQLDGAYNVPESLQMLADRLDENLVFFLGNYLRVPVVAILLMGYLHPKAMIGIFVVLATAFLNLRITQTSTSPIPDSLQTIQAFSWVAAFLAMAWSRCVIVLLRSILIATFVVTAHASLRRAQSEYRSAAPPGVAFTDFLGIGLRGGRGDPRRLLRELWHVLAAHASYSAWAASAWLQQQLTQLRPLLRRSWRPPRPPRAEMYVG